MVTARKASCVSSPPTAVSESHESAGFVPHVPRLFSGTLLARSRFSHTTGHTVSPDAETFRAQMAKTVLPTTASETAPRRKTTARQLLSMLLQPLPNPHRGR